MKKKKVLLIFLFPFFLYGQSEYGNEHSIDFNRFSFEQKINFSGDLRYYHPYNSSQENLYKNYSFNEFQIRNFNEHNFLNYNITPFPNFEQNKSLYGAYRLNENQWISTYRNDSYYIGLGGNYTIGAMYNYQMGNIMILSAGLSGGKYAINNSFHNNISFSGNAQFLLGDYVRFSVYGSYSINDNNPSYYMPYGMYPQTTYGGNMEFKITDKFGLMVGYEREFDIRTRRWVDKPYIVPVFYK